MIDLSQPTAYPDFGEDTDLAQTAVEVRVPPYSRPYVFADGAIFVFSQGADGQAVGSVPRKRLDAAQAAAGPLIPVGPAVQDQTYARFFIAKQNSGDTVLVEVMLGPPEKR
ncbi:MAG: hypothetical protein AAFV53_23290 [Myxococcota bacterium]